MLTNYLKIAIRNLLANRAFSIINVTGLAIGLACVIVIMAYVQLEMSYDTFHPDHENIYRITTLNRPTEHTAYSYLPLAPLLKENMSGLKQAVRIFPHSGLVSKDKKNKIRENNFCYADSGFFEMFNFRILDGSVADALHKPMMVVISKSKALTYFGMERASGKELFLEDNGGTHSYQVAAVMDDMPENSHFNIHFIASLESLVTTWPEVFNPRKAWYWPPVYLYVQMTHGHTAENITGQLNAISRNHLPHYVGEKSFAAQKLADIHLNSRLLNEWQANSSYTYIWIFSGIASFILLLACINYINLATSRSLQRAGEVGIRKALGSYKSQLARMFFVETLLTSALAIVAGLAAAQLSMTMIFNPLLHKTLSIDFFLEGNNLAFLLAGWLTVSALAGIYPSLYISSFNVIKVLKGKGRSPASALGLRKGFVAFQFFISSLLIVSALVVIRQVDFLREKDLGFNQEHIVTIPLNDFEDRKNYLNFKNKILDLSFVKDASVSAALPYGVGFYDWEIVPEGHTDTKGIVVRTIGADEDFLKTYNIGLLAGRDFSKDILSDKEQGFIINQALARQLDWDDPVGKEFQLTFYTDGANIRKGKVIGVVADFHFQSLHDKISPLVIFINTHPYYTNHLSVRLEGGSIANQVNSLHSEWDSFSPERPFEFSFLDENLNRLYENEMTTSRLLSIFTVLSIFISCLGLFGLTSFSVQQRTKEIGIRKVLGASVLGVTQLLSKEFLKLVLVGVALSIPVAWYAMYEWLQNFAYHIELSAWMFIVSGLVAIFIALFTVSFQSIKAAVANPVDSLRNE